MPPTRHSAHEAQRTEPTLIHPVTCPQVIMSTEIVEPAAPHTIRLSDFLERTREQLTSQASGLLAPQYTADHHAQVMHRLQGLRGDPLKPAQADAAGAAALGLTTHPMVWVVGEQRVGKTRVALAAAFLAHATRILVVTPPHVVSTWAKKEIPAVWPHATVCIVKRLADLDRITALPTPCIVVLSREHAKLNGIRTPASIRRSRYARQRDRTISREDYWSCPHCGTALLTPGNATPIEHHRETPAQCHECHAPLWTFKHPDIHGTPAPRRVALSKPLLTRFRHWFDCAIFDEVHEYANHLTCQGISMSHLVQIAPMVIGLTATLTNGYASSLFSLLWRTDPNIRAQYEPSSVTKWITTYGLWRRTTRFLPCATPGGPKKTREKTTIKETPGVSPSLISLFLDRTVYLRMKDLGAAMPPYREEMLAVEMSREQQATYAHFQQAMRTGMRAALAAHDWTRLSLLTTSLMTWPDRCWIEEPAKHHPTYLLHQVPLPPVLSTGHIYPKERMVLELIHRNRAEGRKVLLYATHTGTRDITARLHALATREGLRSAILPKSVSAEHRLDWINSHSGALDVLITHPQSVATGIPLTAFPTVLFFEPCYSTYILRQAARRSWDLNQRRDVRVYYSSYLHTAQEQAWMMIGQRIKTALLLEGEFEQTETGLATYRQEGDFLLDLAKHIIATNNPENDALRQLFHTCRSLEGLPDPLEPVPPLEPPLGPAQKPALVRPPLPPMTRAPFCLTATHTQLLLFETPQHTAYVNTTADR